MPKTNYLLERTTWEVVKGDPKRFNDDLKDQRHPIVGFHLLGKCPACQHDTIGICPASTVTASAVGLQPVEPVLAVVVGGSLRGLGGLVGYVAVRLLGQRTTVSVMQCRCTKSHPPPVVAAPAGSSPGTGPATLGYGCGATWLVQTKYRLLGKEVRSVEPVAPDDEFKYWQAADAVVAATPNSLTALQSIASKWQAALTAILGLLGVTALVGGRDTLEKLADQPRLIIGLAAAVAVATSALALFAFARASAGVPRIKPLGSPSGLVNADLAPLRQAWFSAVWFRVAFVAAFVSLVATAVAVRYVWYGAAADESAKVKITVQVGQDTLELCGVVTVASPDSITITPGAENREASGYELSQIIKIGSC